MTRAITIRCSVAVLVAAVCFHFLVFAQFAFLALLREIPNAALLKPAMAAMGAGGILGSLMTPALLRRWNGAACLRAGLACSAAVAAGCAAGFLAASLPLLTAFLTGLTTGCATVALAGQLRTLLGDKGWGLPLGVGAGFAYFAANVPAVFTASPNWQAGAAAAVCLSAALLPLPSLETSRENPPAPMRRSHAAAGILVFTILVGLDSAIFYIVQHTEPLQEATWGNDFLLWRNGAVHLAAAVAAGWSLEKGHTVPVLALACVILTSASALIASGSATAAGGTLYPAAVSLYSTALVAWPAYLSRPASQASALRRAAALYAISGWAGSGMGISLAENVRGLNAGFVGLLAAATAVAAAVLITKHRRPLVSSASLLASVALTAHWLDRAAASPGSDDSAVKRGRAVYIAEGCIHCHSRYPRPDTTDEIFWGPSVDHREIVSEKPVLIGNRRHGPDLLQVGNRRSAGWLREQLSNPRLLQPGSIMPRYAHLFEDSRGEDLIAFLSSVPEGSYAARIATVNAWKPPDPHPRGGADLGRILFGRLCAVCHGVDGRGDGVLASRFARPPANLVAGPLPHTGDAWPPNERRIRAQRVVKFGILGSDMPGHETLEDEEIAALSGFVLQLRQEAIPKSP